MPSLPSSLALSGWPVDGSAMVAAPGRTDLASIQTATNAVIAALTGGASGDVLGGVGTTLTYAKPPGYEYAYNEFTANVSITATSEATANTVVTATAVTFDGATAVRIEFFSAAVTKGTGITGLWLYDGAASIGEIGFTTGSTTVTSSRRLTPSAAAHTYSVRGSVDAGTGSVSAGVGGLGAVMPGFIRITKV